MLGLGDGSEVESTGLLCFSFSVKPLHGVSPICALLGDGSKHQEGSESPNPLFIPSKIGTQACTTVWALPHSCFCSSSSSMEVASSCACKWETMETRDGTSCGFWSASERQWSNSTEADFTSESKSFWALLAPHSCEAEKRYEPRKSVKEVSRSKEKARQARRTNVLSN